MRVAATLGSRWLADRGRRRRGALLVACVAAWAAAIVAPAWPVAAAHAATSPEQYSEGVPGQPFRLATPLPDGVVQAGGSDQRLSLGNQVLWQLDRSSPGYAGWSSLDPAFPVQPPDPRCVQALPNGHVLVADRSNVLVAEFDRDGEIVWWYSLPGGPNLHRLANAQRLTNGNTLICDRLAARVFEVDRDKQVVWQYGVTGKPGLGVNQIKDPFMAVRLADGNTLICDSQGGYRMIEVRSSDYEEGAPDNGYTAASIVWQYGSPGVKGTGANELCKPHWAQRLAGGDTLIMDSGEPLGGEDGSPPVPARILRIDPGGRVVRQWGPGDVEGGLNDSNQAVRLEDRGTTLVADTRSDRVIEFSDGGAAVWQYGGGDSTLYQPRSAVRAANGSTLIADTLNHRVVQVGYPASARVTSQPLVCGTAITKRFTTLSWTTTGMSATSVRLEYRLDSGPWLSAGSAGSFSFPAGSYGTTLTYRTTLSTTDRARTPGLESVTVHYRRYFEDDQGRVVEATPAPTTDAGATTTGDRATGTSSGSGSGGGSENGSGSGSASGSRSGSGAYATAGAAAGGGSSAEAITPPAAGGGPSELRLDTPVAADEPTTTVSGSRLTVGGGGAAGGSSGGGHATVPGDPPLGRATRVLALLAGLTAVCLVVPWPIVGRQMRRLRFFDHTASARHAEAQGYAVREEVAQ